MVICGSYMHKFNVDKDMKKKKLTMIKGERRWSVVGKMAAHLCLTLIIKELEVSVEHDRVITTLNIIKH
jgi:hypothetical protein